LTPSTPDDPRRYLDPKVLARISGLELRARLALEGYLSGMHHSPHTGLSIEFADHRQYTQGDDLRRLDWKVFGKTDKYYIKEYEQETNLNVVLVVDGSESMHYRSRDDILTKYEYATCLCAAVAYLALQQRDAVGLAVFDDHLKHFLRPANNADQWKALVRELCLHTGRGETSLGRVLGELAERLARREVIVLISDLFDDPEAALRGFKQLRFRRHELIVWNLWDDAELRFPFTGPTLFDGLERGGRLLTEPTALRERYLAEVEQFQERMKRGCGAMQVDYVVFNTSAPLDGALSAYLATRTVRLRARAAHVARGA
jgi:uncharacterized protein (DUF58 family)